jgi:hypothetical protein
MNPIKTIISDFTSFTMSKFHSRGYSTHALCGAVFAFVPIPYIAIKVSLFFLIGVLYEIMMLRWKMITPDYADARWGAYGCLIFSLLILWIG